jgi:hypothetical protein
MSLLIGQNLLNQSTIVRSAAFPFSLIIAFELACLLTDLISLRRLEENRLCQLNDGPAGKSTKQRLKSSDRRVRFDHQRGEHILSLISMANPMANVGAGTVDLPLAGTERFHPRVCTTYSTS